jgi:acyl carrier protein phosphodiesterase
VNHLAHLFLARDTPESMIGNLAGDFVKGPIHGTDAISEGIRNHRRIDAFTDTHPAVAAFRRVLIPEYGHYARVISDVFFDYFLANSFPRYSTETHLGFVDRAFAMMDGHPKPEKLERVYPYLKGWMRSYFHDDGIFIALKGISGRLSRRPRLEMATSYLYDSHSIELERRFHEFFPDVVAFSAR